VHSRLSIEKRSAWVLVAAPILAMASLSVAAASTSTAPVSAARRSAAHAVRWVQPNQVSEVDCNGWSPKYQAVDPSFRRFCTDPHGVKGEMTWPGASAGYRDNGRFLDNGHYVGHDEPSVEFISSAAGSGNTMTYYLQMPRNPVKKPTDNGKVVDYAELGPAIWFGLPMCDPRSYPRNPCTPDSDANSGVSTNPHDAGSAFMELQLFPPGFGPYIDGGSCSRTRWCAGMAIDSLESKFNFVGLNPDCEETGNFAFLQTNGVPTGPPSPQLLNVATFTPNARTLLIGAGDVIKVAMTDPRSGFTATVTDLTTGRSGFMTASAANGFMDTSYKTCAGRPFTFHAEYATAAPQNQTPWADLEGGVLIAQETGHSEVCRSLTHLDSVSNGSAFVDNKIFNTCVGGSGNDASDKGQGDCNLTTGVCQNPTTEGTTGPIACPSNNFGSGQLCEYADGLCLPRGTRTVTFGRTKIRETSPINLCEDDQFENGDLDFDGVSYQKASWPDGSPNVPTSIRFAGPFDRAGSPYPEVRFETDIGASEFLCDIQTGTNCDAPPLGARFYPFWTLTSKVGQSVGHGLFRTGACIWNVGNVIKGITTRDLGKDAEYGVPDVARSVGTVISKIERNPEIDTSHGCTALTMPGPGRIAHNGGGRTISAKLQVSVGLRLRQPREPVL
jgi:hypothetical protein